MGEMVTVYITERARFWSCVSKSDAARPMGTANNTTPIPTNRLLRRPPMRCLSLTKTSNHSPVMQFQGEIDGNSELLNAVKDITTKGPKR